MCYMIALGIPLSGIDSARDHFGHCLVPPPEHVAHAFESEYASFILSTGHCACGDFQAPLSAEEIIRLRHKFEARGWKESRIERVLDQRRKLGGLERGILQRIVTAASSGTLTLMVYRDDGRTIPNGPSMQLSAEELLAKPHLVQAGTKIRIRAGRSGAKPYA